jgi:hypothetical protein
MEDPIIPNQGVMRLDRFAYVMNNPMLFIDPSGNKVCQWGNHDPKCTDYSDVDYHLDHQIERPDNVCKSNDYCHQSYLTYKSLVWELHYVPPDKQILYMTAQAEGYSTSGVYQDAFVEGLARNFYQPYQSCINGSPTCTTNKLYKFLSGYQPWWDGSKSSTDRASDLLGQLANDSSKTDLEADIKDILNYDTASDRGWNLGKIPNRPWQWSNYWRPPESGEAIGYIATPKNIYGAFWWIMTDDQNTKFNKDIKPIQVP